MAGTWLIRKARGLSLDAITQLGTMSHICLSRAVSNLIKDSWVMSTVSTSRMKVGRSFSPWRVLFRDRSIPPYLFLLHMPWSLEVSVLQRIFYSMISGHSITHRYLLRPLNKMNFLVECGRKLQIKVGMCPREEEDTLWLRSQINPKPFFMEASLI